MIGYFHFGLGDVILFEGLKTNSTWSIIVVSIVVLVLTALIELLKLVRFKFETKQRDSIDDIDYMNVPLDDGEYYEQNEQNSSRTNYIKFNFKIEILRALIKTLESFWALVIMLVIMTFHSGIFIATILGTFIGVLLFGRDMSVLSVK